MLIPRIDRVHWQVFTAYGLALAEFQRVEAPSLALGDRDQPTLPVAIAVGLVAEELHPRERARVLDHLPGCVDTRGDRLRQLDMELAVEIELVTADS